MMKTVIFSISIAYIDTAGKTHNQIAEALASAIENIGIDEYELDVRKTEIELDNRDPRAFMQEE